MPRPSPKPPSTRDKKHNLIKHATSAIEKDMKGLENFVVVSEGLYELIQTQSNSWSRIHKELSAPHLKKLLLNLTMGISPIISFACIGLSKNDYYAWLRAAADKKEPYSTLMKIIEIAQAESCSLLHSKVLASNSSSAKWVLERRFRDDYGQKTSTELTISQPLNQLTDEQLHQLLEEEQSNQQKE